MVYISFIWILKITYLAITALENNDNKIVERGNIRINKIKKNLFKFKKLKNTKFKNLIYIEVIWFIISETKVTFN